VNTKREAGDDQTDRAKIRIVRGTTRVLASEKNSGLNPAVIKGTAGDDKSSGAS